MSGHPVAGRMYKTKSRIHIIT
ncbi:hypothetical protein F383_33935 [Gossypium arboreum]|uniref:Uncharacterized protein n=1 Tax=Gossypium arboreum TaxID=29729 RepID=A0A0B0N495_GOSAR|nr:hypothetical protein F383_33935 [Gossypium arboreum]